MQRWSRAHYRLTCWLNVLRVVRTIGVLAPRRRHPTHSCGARLRGAGVMRRFGLLLLSGLLAAGCAPPAEQAPPEEGPASDATATTTEEVLVDAGPAPERAAFFGDLHVHTAYSYDAFVFGTRADPDAAHEFAKGNPIEHPAGFTMQLDTPLDFHGVSDHANYLGMLPAMLDPEQPAYNHPAADTVRTAKTATERRGIFRTLQPYVRQMEDADPSVAEHLDMDVVRSAWSEIVASANRHNDPGTYTAFIAYEYTSAGAGGIYNNLHRNVVFRGSDAPAAPFSRLDSFNPEDLWDVMDAWRADGIDSLAIPHNMNGSGGRMFELTYFDRETPIDAAYVDQRARNETTVEITQTKGTSETHPALSPNDEWAGFEIMPYRVSTSILSEPEGSYVRNALHRGLEIAEGGLANPYKFGFIGSSDTHTAAGAFNEETYWDAAGLSQVSPDRRGSVPVLPDSEEAAGDTVDDGSGRQYRLVTATTHGASGLAGVWAEANTRASLFDAMRRRETFATSGPRIRVRCSGGQGRAGLPPAHPHLAPNPAGRGGPGGGRRPAPPAPPPTFLAWAARDPLAAPLQRMQIVKGWLAEGATGEIVYDVACSDGLTVDPETHRCPPNGATVDFATCAISADAGASELQVVWTDPDFNPAQPAFYYVRVLENPTCRWSTWDALRAGVAPRQDFAAAIQERAWSSPIWYTGAAETDPGS
ncbi:MAG: DUF3604 domain-containing protein [Gammaproteobacteria bacterium]|nr:DUF3604 domain-containing protein [Gammaproteobacteria bacterium]